jgi:hypothetical protein
MSIANGAVRYGKVKTAPERSLHVEVKWHDKIFDKFHTFHLNQLSYIFTMSNVIQVLYSRQSAHHLTFRSLPRDAV